MNPDSSRNQVIRCSGVLHPAIDSVISNDDLLVEILVRLPIVPLLSFKRVSKHWLSLIKHPSFTTHLRQRTKIDPPTCLLVKCTDSPAHDLFQLKSSRFVHRFHFHILQSCNGLLLCLDSRNPHNKEMFVYNPFANWKHIFADCGQFGRTRIAYDPAKSFGFKFFGVVPVLFGVSSFVACVHVYSSETNQLDFYTGYCYECFEGFGYGVYWNNAIHWVNTLPLKTPSHYKLISCGNEYPVLAEVQLPKLHWKLNRDIKIFVTGGSLVLVCWDYEHSNLLGIYEMKNGCADWRFKYFVDLNDVLKAFGKPYWRVRKNVISIVLGETPGEDSFMLIELGGDIVEYKFNFKMFRPLCGFGSHSSHSCFEFIASFVPGLTPSA